MNTKNRFLADMGIEFGALICLYRVTLDWAYSKVALEVFSYAGFYESRTALSTALSWVLLAVFAWIAKKLYDNEENRLSYEVLYILFLMSFVPFTTMLGYGAVEMPFCVANCVYWLLLLGSFLLIPWDKRPYQLVRETHFLGDLEIDILALLSFLVVLYVSGRYASFRFNFSLSNVYDLRLEARQFALPTILKYLFAWTRMATSIMIAFYIRRKRWIWAAAGVLVQLLSFGIDGSKTTLLLMVATVGISLLPAFSFAAMNKWILRGFVFLMLAFMLLFVYASMLVPISLFARRMMFLPVQISGYYWDFFSTHVADYFRQSFLRHFGFQSPYSSIPFMIGELYLGNSETSANNGLLSDAVANLGYAGIAVYPLLLSYVFGLLDRCARGLDKRICIAVSLYVAVVLTNSFLFTILLTHGLLIAMLLLTLMKRENVEEEALRSQEDFEG